MSSKPSPPERFKQNTLILFDIITEMFTEGSDHGIIQKDIKLISLLRVVLESCNGERMINNFIKKTNKYWDNIHSRDIDYFKENGMSFFTSVKDEGLDKAVDEDIKKDNTFLKNLNFGHLNSFKILLESSYLKDGKNIDIFNDERKEDVWKILESLVKISVVYIHQERKYVDGNYSQEYYPEISIKDNIQKWKIRSIRL